MRLGKYVAPGGDPEKGALTVTGARAKARKLQTEVDDGGDPATARQVARAEARAQTIRTIDDLAESYFAASRSGEYRPSGKRKRAQTIRQEGYVYAKYLAPIGKMRVEALTRDGVKKMLRDLLEAGRGVTSNRVRSLLSQIYAWGVVEGRVARNPAAEVADLAEEIPRMRVLTDEELRALWQALDDPSGLRRPLPNGRDEAVMVSRPVRIAIHLALTTLQRRAEVARMEITELDFAKAIWTIPASKTKAGRPTAVPLGETSLALIREAIALRPPPLDGAPSPYVFPGRGKQEPHLSPQALSHAMRDLRAGIGAPDITVHDLRRTGATRLAMAGVSPFILSRLLNHAGDLRGGSPVTMAVYVQHDFMPEKRAAMETLDRVLRQISVQPDRQKVREPLRFTAAA